MGRIILFIMTLLLVIFLLLNLSPNIYSLNKFINFDCLMKHSEQQPANIGSATGNADFNQAVAFTLQHEGGLENDKSDRGGITNYGISYAFLRHLLTHNPNYLSLFSLTHIAQIKPSIIRNLTLQQAIQIYKIQWWDKYHYGAIQNQAIATKAFDYSVNMGHVPAIKLLQKAINSINKPIRANGQLDNSTIAYINKLNSFQINKLLIVYEKLASKRYIHIAHLHPADKKFLLGWLRRANDNNQIST